MAPLGRNDVKVSRLDAGHLHFVPVGSDTRTAAGVVRLGLMGGKLKGGPEETGPPFSDRAADGG